MFKRTRDYAKDYERDGKSVRYTGKVYLLNLPKPQLNLKKSIYLISLFAAVALYVALGFSGSAALGGGGTPAAVYVVLPYVGLLLPLGLGLARAVLLVLHSKSLEFAEYDKYLVQQKGVFIGMLALSGCLSIGLLVYLFADVKSIRSDILVFAESLVCAGCILCAFFQYHAIFDSVLIDENNSVRYDS